MGNTRDGTDAWTVRALCIFVLATILTAGLWPFHVPNNEVSWLINENGLRFGRNGTALSYGTFPATPPHAEGACSLEIWLKPGSIDSESTILAFDSSADRRLPFSLRQYGTSVAIQRYMVDDKGIVRRPWLKIDHVFRERQPVFVTIAAGKSGTAVYVDGVLVEYSSTLGLMSKDMSGRLVIANSTVDDSWPGQLMGLAIYDQELTSSQVARHVEGWTSKARPTLDGEDIPRALYLFDERGGNVAHNRVDPATDLRIPAKYFVLHPVFLRSTWNQYFAAKDSWVRWSNWQDIGVNIAGFVPLGFLFSAYFSSVRRIGRPILGVILLGLGLSFAIEALQALLPTRDSSMTDLITNTLGTGLGVLLYRFCTLQTLLTQVAVFRKQQSAKFAIVTASRSADEKNNVPR